MVVKPNRSGGAAYPSGYTDAGDHAMIGNMRTCALVSISGTIAQLCLPHFDSPSVFARILDKNKGGHFSIRTTIPTQSKQQYVPSTNVVNTKFLSEEGVGQIDDYMPLPASKSDPTFLPWLVRHVTTIRGTLTFTVECAPAFDYARASHETKIDNKAQRADFICPEHLNLDLRWVISEGEHPKDGVAPPTVELDYLDLNERGHKGLGVIAQFTLHEGQSVTFVLREPPKEETSETSGVGSKTANIPDFTKSDHGDTQAKSSYDPRLSQAFIDRLYHDTVAYWLSWLQKCTYKGRWRENVQRAALALKLLTFAPTGAIVAAATFSLPEDLHGAGRNWDYRYAWIRDASFTVYALLRLGFTEEADQYVDWLSGLMKTKNKDGSLQIMYTIHGTKEIPEIELHHLDGHKGQRPVRIGNGAADHRQLDIFGELLDAVYLAQKMGRPLAYDDWLQVREIVDYVCEIWREPDLSIWEVRGQMQHFLYSKVMCWVALDRGLRLADKRSLPCPNRNKWLANRDELYEQIMDKGYNKEMGFFSQSYENKDVLDAAILIMPLVFFMTANDPRFQNTLNAIVKPKDRGGLTENNLVYRYDTQKVDDGTGGGEEGSFSMVTLWLVEALARAGQFEPAQLSKAVTILEDFLGYTNHVGLLSEEISKGGEALGNMAQAFSLVLHISLDGMKADDAFAKLCPNINVTTYCASPPSTGTCCGICPNSGISGLGGHISLLFSTLASPIAMAPQAAPTSLVSSLIQANAYALTTLGYLLSDASGLDFFHASYALMLAFSSLIPLAAIAASPPWAITGQKSPGERKDEAQRMVLDVVGELDHSESNSDDDERRHLRRRRKKRREKLIRIINEDPGLVLDLGRSSRLCGIPSSHWMLYIGFFASVLLWGFVLYLGVLGGATGSTRTALSQPNCTAGLGEIAALMVYANIAFMFIGIAIFVATIVNHLMHDVAGALNRQVELEYTGSPRLVFGVAFAIWLLWFGVSFSLYFAAGNANLLSAGEFSWGFGSVFSALMILVPGYSIIKTLLSLR